MDASKDGRIKLSDATLKALRQRKGLSQEALADECLRSGIHLSISTIKRAESGKSIIYRSAKGFADFYHVSLDALTDQPAPPGARAPTPAPAGYEVVVADPGHPLIGRQFELAQAKSLINDTIATHHGRVLYIRGAAGIGKSLLVNAIRATVAADLASFYVSCPAHKRASWHYPLSELLKQCLSAICGHPVTGGAGLEQALAQLRVDAEEQVHLYNLLYAAVPEDLTQTNVDLDFSARIAGEIEAFIAVVGRFAQGAVLIFEDVHWCSSLMLRGLQRIAAGVRNMPVALIISARIEDDPIDTLWRSGIVNTPIATFDLSPLNYRDAEQLAEIYPNVDQDFRQQAIKLSDGNPLFLDQLLHSYPNYVGTVPTSLQSLIGEKVECLPAECRALVELASIVDDHFSMDMIQALSGHADTDVAPLMIARVIQPAQGDTCAFTHTLVRQSIYNNLPAETRRKLHLQVAQWYKTDNRALYAYHLRCADNFQAILAYKDAAIEQMDAHNYADALAFVDQALNLAPENERGALDLLKGTLLRQLELPEKSLVYLKKAVDSSAEEVIINRAAIELAISYQLLHRFDEAERLLLDTIERLRNRDQDKLLTIATYCLNKIDRLADSTHARQGEADHMVNLMSSNELIDRLNAVYQSIPRSAQPSARGTVEEQPVTVGVLHSLSGVLYKQEIGAVQASLLTISEINQNGGLLGRAVHPVVVDGCSEESAFQRCAATLIEDHEVAAIFGSSTSSIRRSVIPIVEHNRTPLFYPFHYEGIERSKYVVYVGPLPNQYALPAVEWLFCRNARRFFLLGSDYVYPRVTNAIVKDKLERWGGKIAGERYFPLGQEDFTVVIDEIERCQPDTILLTLAYLSEYKQFLEQCYARGISAQRTNILSLVMTENDLLSISPDCAKGVYCSRNYFQNIEGIVNDEFVRRYKKTFGQHSWVSSDTEAAYCGVHLWAKAVQKAGTFDSDKVIAALGGTSYYGPGGIAYVDESNRHVWRHARLAQVGADGELHVRWCSEAPLAPEPFPAERSVSQWKAFIAEIKRDWAESWRA